MTFEQLYKTVLQRKLGGSSEPLPPHDKHQLDCLLHPEKYPSVIRIAPCSGEECASDARRPACQASCLFEAIVPGPDGGLTIDIDRCTGCSACIDACKAGKLTASRDILPALDAVKNAKNHVYAMMTPMP